MRSSRRLFFQASAALAATGKTRHHARAEGTPHEWQNGRSPWPMCLDTATLAKELPLDKKIIKSTSIIFINIMHGTYSEIIWNYIAM